MIKIDENCVEIKGNIFELTHELSNGVAIMIDKNKKAPKVIQDIFIECMIIGIAAGYADIDLKFDYIATDKQYDDLRAMAKEVTKAIKLIAKAIEEREKRCSGK